MNNDIVIKPDCNGKPKYRCPHCGCQLTIQIKAPKCRKCGGQVSWENVS